MFLTDRGADVDFELQNSLATKMNCGSLIVDFSLDIEGGEFQVLKTIPWDKVKTIFHETSPSTI